MKRVLNMTIVFAMLFSLCACGNTGQAASEGTSDSPQAAEQAAEQAGGQTEVQQAEPAESAQAETAENAASAPVVYFTSDISAAGLVRIYEQLGWTPEGKVAVKISTGEPPASNYLRPELIGDLVQKLDGTIVECNTAYGGSRANSAMHHQVAEDHGFTAIADFDLMDEEGEMRIPVTVPEGMSRHLTEDVVGSHFADYDGFLILSHFKGHAMAGFGGAIKNISIGISSPTGKCLIHSGGKSETSPWGGDQTDCTESMAEAGKTVSN